MILVSGYYGFGNLGDEAILAALCQDLVSLGISRRQIVVPSGNPQQTAAEHGVSVLGRCDLKGIWRVLSSARCMVSGGGSLLQDATSKRSLPYYLSLVELALLRRVPVVMYAQGLGPISSGPYKSWTARVYKRAAACSVRDEDSLRFLEELGVPEEKIVLAADPVFARGLAANTGERTRRLLLNLRPHEGWPEQSSLWLEHLLRWEQEGWSVEFLPLGPGDQELGAFLQTRCPGLKVHAKPELSNLDRMFQGAALCISMRLHGLIFSALNDCQPVGVNYDPKVAAVCAQLRVPYVELGELGRLPELVSQVLTAMEEQRQGYQRALGELQRRTAGNRRVLAQVLR
ncbi:MAG: polysaccharide pyruvyl transferase CsaB [Limnochordia bacterium]|nr:polysaccharide pyruvyl transferase CsaB [Bacillota bacterium]NLL07411.1 polysaccharide pyruvyl transferase CsaB [Bacillota bacterium]